HGNREVLQNVAMTVVTEQSHGLRVAELRVVDESALLLFEALARIELRGDGSRLIGVCGELRGRKTQRILGVGSGHDGRDEGQFVILVEAVIELAVERLVARAAVIPIAVDDEVRERRVVTERARGAAGRYASTKRVEATVCDGAA